MLWWVFFKTGGRLWWTGGRLASGINMCPKKKRKSDPSSRHRPHVEHGDNPAPNSWRQRFQVGTHLEFREVTWSNVLGIAHVHVKISQMPFTTLNVISKSRLRAFQRCDPGKATHQSSSISLRPSIALGTVCRPLLTVISKQFSCSNMLILSDRATPWGLNALGGLRCCKVRKSKISTSSD